MLKIQVFNTKHPLETRELEFSIEESPDREFSIGNSPDCAIILGSPHIEPIAATIRPQNQKYYFTALAHDESCQYNEESVEIERPYPLDIDDIIRLHEYVLIVETLPFSENATRRRKPGNDLRKNRKNSDTGSNRSLQQLKTRLTQKNAAPPPTPSPLSPPPIASPTPSRLSPPPIASPSPEKDLGLRCIGIIAETHDVKTFRFVATSPMRFSYKAGQFITLKLHIDGKPVSRAYSISSTPSRPDVLEITVKRVPAPPDVPDAPPGLVSNWLHDTLKVGDSLQTKGIGGKFTCVDHPSRKLLLISAGSGITPMMAMSRWVYDTGSEHDIVFFHSARDRQDIIFDRELQLLARQNPRFHLAISLTRCEDPTWQGWIGRLDEKMIAEMAPDYKERTVYVCGPESFMKATKSLLISIDFPMENYHEESFGGVKKAPKTKTTPPTGNQTAVVVLAKSGQDIPSDGEETILDLAEAAGIPLSAGCRSGNCGTCKVQKLAGEVKYTGEPTGLETAEREAGYILTCIACPVDRVVIDA